MSWAIASLIGEIKRERLYVWGVRSGTSIIDQGLTSLAGLLISLLLARWLGGESYGAFAVIYATVLFLAGFHSVLILEPMSVFGPASHAARITDYMFAQIKVHVIALAALSGAMLVAGMAMMRFGIHRELASAVLGAALAMPFLLLAWLVRRMCYVIHRPAIAVRGSVVYLLMIMIGLAAMRAGGWLNPCSAFLLMGVAGLLSVLWMLQPLGLLRAPSNGLQLAFGMAPELALRKMACRQHRPIFGCESGADLCRSSDGRLKRSRYSPRHDDPVAGHDTNRNCNRASGFAVDGGGLRKWENQPAAKKGGSVYDLLDRNSGSLCRNTGSFLATSRAAPVRRQIRGLCGAHFHPRPGSCV